MRQIVVIGGGAAGFFAALASAENNPDAQVTILEKSSTLLSKVKISGGGRCNVTHACFDAKELIKNYPRGEKQLLGPFTRFNPSHTVDWFEAKGVKLKREADGRMFPATDSSQTIIDCFLQEAKRLGVAIKMQTGVETIKPDDAKFHLVTNKNTPIIADAVIITTGSGSSMWSLLSGLGHTIVPPVPSLFTFNINDQRIKGLEGLSVPHATVSVVPPATHKAPYSKLSSTGPLLITHWGMSGPAILRLSAWGARILSDSKHQFEIEINWTGEPSINELRETIKQFKQSHPKKVVSINPLLPLPKRLWERLSSTICQTSTNYADLSNKQIEGLATALAASRFHVLGKSTFKDEFVTAGGVSLDEVDFKTMQSKIIPGLYFAGEVLDMDAITGGFNFQAAWTTGWVAGNAI
ncbi:MAG: NAD(P)/FAD-dependent oxidoreductase [Bacteroidetes bacterium]|nr:NAD(P)/FAD-dependent oxidoreductase [Bacteroidota bacterium]